MPYVERDVNGDVSGTFNAPQSTDQEYLPDDDPAVLAYLARVNALSEPPPP